MVRYTWLIFVGLLCLVWMFSLPGCGSSGSANSDAQSYTDAWIQTAIDDVTYFPGTLRLVYMLLAAQRFPAGCQ